MELKKLDLTSVVICSLLLSLFLVQELEIMVKTKKKAEIQALSSFGFQYITEVYLPRKLREGDWI